MKITEFIENLKDNTNLKEILEIRTYIPVTEKRVIFETILDKCFRVEDGVLICDSILKKMMLDLAIIKYHTDLEIDIESENDYDEIKKTGINFHSEYLADYNECYVLFNEMENELRSRYSIDTSIIQLSNKLLNNLENLMNGIIKKIEDFDMSSFGFEGVELDQFKNLLNKYGQ